MGDATYMSHILHTFSTPLLLIQAQASPTSFTHVHERYHTFTTPRVIIHVRVRVSVRGRGRVRVGTIVRV